MLGGAILSAKKSLKENVEKIFASAEDCFTYIIIADELRVNPDRCERETFESAKKNLRI